MNLRAYTAQLFQLFPSLSSGSPFFQKNRVPYTLVLDSNLNFVLFLVLPVHYLFLLVMIQSICSLLSFLYLPMSFLIFFLQFRHYFWPVPQDQKYTPSNWRLQRQFRYPWVWLLADRNPSFWKVSDCNKK